MDNDLLRRKLKESGFETIEDFVEANLRLLPRSRRDVFRRLNAVGSGGFARRPEVSCWPRPKLNCPTGCRLPAVS